TPDIARRLQIPEGTVRWRLKRALLLLRAELAERLGNERAWCGALVDAFTPAASTTARTVSLGAVAACAAVLVLPPMGREPSAVAAVLRPQAASVRTGHHAAPPTVAASSPAVTRVMA